MARPYAKLRGLMVANDETAEDLARLLLISSATISDRLNNKSEWKLGEMYAIMNHYRVQHNRLNRIFPMNGKNE